MSSMRNAVQNRPYKERAQPKEREKWGILEKHKDYSLRAEDYNEKKKRLRVLRQKAADRNPDEFHFAMMRSKTGSGGQRSADRGNKALSVDMVKLLKTQDANYLRSIAQRTRKSRERLEESTLVHSHASKDRVPRQAPAKIMDRKHTAFVESIQEQLKYSSKIGNVSLDRCLPHEDSFHSNKHTNVDENSSTAGEQASYQNSGNVSSLAHQECRTLRRKRKRALVSRQTRLKALKQQEQDLLLTERELDAQREKLSGQHAGLNKAGVKFKARERRR